MYELVDIMWDLKYDKETFTRSKEQKMEIETKCMDIYIIVARMGNEKKLRSGLDG